MPQMTTTTTRHPMKKVIKAILVFVPLLSASLAGVVHNALHGAHILVPNQNPPSIREGSVGHAHGGGRTRFFVGGGLHGGK